MQRTLFVVVVVVVIIFFLWYYIHDVSPENFAIYIYIYYIYILYILYIIYILYIYIYYTYYIYITNLKILLKSRFKNFKKSHTTVNRKLIKQYQ